MIISHRFVACDPLSVAAVLLQWKKRWPQMGVLAMLPEQEKDAVALLQEVCSSHEIGLKGAIFPALVCEATFRTEGVLLMCMQHMPDYFLLEQMQADDSGARLAGALRALLSRAGTGTVPTLFTVFDAMLPHIGSLLTDMHTDQNPAPVYVGVNAGSETFQSMPCLFDNDRLVQDGVLGLLVSDMKRAAVHHAYSESKSVLRATSASGNRIVTVDNKPAFVAYQDLVADEYGVQLTRENFYEHAVHFPFGLVTAVDILVRIPVGLGEDGSLVCVGEVPPDSMLRVLKAPALQDSQCVRDIRATVQAVPPWGAHDALMTFYCAGRRMHFGSDATAELAQIQAETGCSHVYGALSLGEIDTIEGIHFPRFHNAAVICIAQPGTLDV